MKKEIRIFFTALMFYTRIPCPKWVDHDAEYLNSATKYFPLIGWIVGTLSAITFILAQQLLPLSVAVICSIVIGVLITGAFHEDGFADVCDGFGGGWTKERILDIMKDSRVGAYGVIGMVLLLLLKYELITATFATHSLFRKLDIPTALFILLVFVAAHSVSRFIAATFIFTHSYVRENDDAKAKPVAKKVSVSHIVQCAIWGLVPLVLLALFDYRVLFLLPLLLLVKWRLAKYFTKWIGGYTGDCLGATQQVCELFFYIGMVSLLSF
jgi:adenosylcobinamide-GDP ribazoletransferase